MKKMSIYAVVGVAIAGIVMLATSCKEQGKLQVVGEFIEKTYISDTIPTAQTKRILIDEMSGVDCVNCPAGAESLEKMNEDHDGRLEIVTIHAGVLTRPFPESRQDMRMPETKRNLYLKIMGDPAKPCAAFDRQILNTSVNKYMTEGASKWPASLAKANEVTSTPINIELKSSFNAETKVYDIEVSVKYTQQMAGVQALHIYLTESKIMDIQNTQDNKRAEYEFNHVLRDIITPVDGKPFLTDIANKEVGRVYNLQTSFKIDATDQLQKNWVPENMTVVAFVAAFDPNDIHVYQVQSKKLLQ